MAKLNSRRKPARKQRNERCAASCVIHDADKMTPKGRKNIAAWLRRQAGFLTKYGSRLDPRFTARYMCKA